MSARHLNLGCGGRFDPTWTNVDLAAHAPQVIAADLSQPLPFAPASFDAVYAAHLLEHFLPAEGLVLLRDVRRVLAPGGVVRIVVPDGEELARSYLDALAAAAGGDPDARARHEWMAIELIDQMVRRRSGGLMSEFATRRPLPVEAFLKSRLGPADFAELTAAPRPAPDVGYPTIGQQLTASSGGAWAALRARLVDLLVDRDPGGARAKALHEALFRATGESHRWLYDRVSLPALLAEAGFTAPRRLDFRTSAIVRLWECGLDHDDGRERKPNSLYFEATA